MCQNEDNWVTRGRVVRDFYVGSQRVELVEFTVIGVYPWNGGPACHWGRYGSAEEAALAWAKKFSVDCGIVWVMMTDHADRPPERWQIEAARPRAFRMV